MVLGEVNFAAASRTRAVVVDGSSVVVVGTFPAVDVLWGFVDGEVVVLMVLTGPSTVNHWLRPDPAADTDNDGASSKVAVAEQGTLSKEHEGDYDKDGEKHGVEGSGTRRRVDIERSLLNAGIILVGPSAFGENHNVSASTLQSLRRDLKPAAQFLMYSRCSLTVSLSRNFNTLEPAAQLFYRIKSETKPVVLALSPDFDSTKNTTAIHSQFERYKWGVATDINFNNQVHKLDGVANGSSSKARHTFGWMRIQLGWSSGICTRISWYTNEHLGKRTATNIW
ncbi:hypothetical protein DFH06DRAFT_1135594 [Mycena polygramma]|nr:hypothetical protein DFH06DRAFT_1135594 [Mycena polygramma]